MTTVPQPFEQIAYNQATASENRIHADDVAKRYGFRGGLVPGVTVYAYLVHPAVAAWGEAWLERGRADVVLRKPLYDGHSFRVEVKPDGPLAYSGAVVDDGEIRCAEGNVSLPDAAAPAPARRGDPAAPTSSARPAATRAVMERLREQGLGSARVTWRAAGEMDRYVRDVGAMAEPFHHERASFANPAFTLGLCNRVLSANVVLGPWIHTQSEVQNHGVVARDIELVVEGRIVDLFARGGHEFVDLDVGVFAGEAPISSVRHRAIYQLAEPSDA